MSEAFVHTDEVVIHDGTIIKLPALSLRKILAVTKSVAKLFNAAKKELPAEILTGNMTGMERAIELMKALPQILPNVIEEVSETLSIYLGMDKEKLLDQFTVEDLVLVATPFFSRILKTGNALVSQFNDLFPNIKTLTELPSQSEEKPKDSSQT